MTDAQVIDVEVTKSFDDILNDISQIDPINQPIQIPSLERAIEKLNRSNFLGSDTGVPILYRALALQVSRRIDSLIPDKDNHKEELATLYYLKKEYKNSGGLV